MKKVLGISAFYHDSAAALVVGDTIIAAAQEERFTRKKHTSDFPVHAILYCLDEGGLSIDELDAVVFYDKPLLTFERLLETYYAFAPRGLVSFLKAIPIWLKEKMFLKKQIYDGLREVGAYERRTLTLLFTEHHVSHAASSWFPSPFKSAALLTIDGVGEWATAAIGKAEGNKITFLKELDFPHSVGLLYSAFTYYLGFRVNSGEYKLMGLAPYGDPNAEQTLTFMKKIKTSLVAIMDDGSVWLNQDYFSYATGLRMIREKKWNELFGFPRKDPEEEPEQHHSNLALAIQMVTEEIIIKMAKEAKRLTGARYLCMAGGVALNCVANGKLQREHLFDQIYIQPCAGDAGGALGAALAIAHSYFGMEKSNSDDAMRGAYFGPDYSDKEIERMCRWNKAVYKKMESDDELAEETAAAIDGGNVVGWFQGRMEYGPRALGNRSILADARNEEMQKKLNLKIKYREGFRPFAPAVLEEKVSDYFDFKGQSPYMLLTVPVKEELREKLPVDYASKPLYEKLYYKRSSLQTITHVDFSARIQTVNKEMNPLFWRLIQAFYRKNGCGLVVNTSFNVRGEPIVCTPEDAYRCFMATDMDICVIGRYIFIKKEQPDAGNKQKWLGNYLPD